MNQVRCDEPVRYTAGLICSERKGGAPRRSSRMTVTTLHSEHRDEATLGKIRQQRSYSAQKSQESARRSAPAPPTFLANLPRGHKLAPEQKAELTRYSAARTDFNRKRMSEYMEWKFLESFGATKRKKRCQQQAQEIHKSLLKLRKLSSFSKASSADSVKRQASIRQQQKKEVEEAATARLCRDHGLRRSLRVLRKSQQELVAACSGQQSFVGKFRDAEPPSTSGSSSDSE